MKIKFAQLAAGQRFTFQGATLVKINSLIARNEASGKQQLVPRSSPVDIEDTAAAAAPATVPAWEQIRAAFEDYCAASTAGIDAVAAGADAEQAKQTLAQARRRFLDLLPG